LALRVRQRLGREGRGIAPTLPGLLALRIRASSAESGEENKREKETHCATHLFERGKNALAAKATKSGGRGMGYANRIKHIKVITGRAAVRETVRGRDEIKARAGRGPSPSPSESKSGTRGDPKNGANMIVPNSDGWGSAEVGGG